MLIEFIFIGVGDCEDYFIVKYFLLREFGIFEENLWLMYVIVLR